MNLKDIQVSCFKHCKESKNPTTVNLVDWINCTHHKKQVDLIRTEKNKDNRDRLKRMLPAITPSGIFSERKKGALIKHSGFICLDIDLQDNTSITNYDDLSTELIKINNIAYIGKSVSGNGLFVLIPVAHPERHESHFRALQQDFKRFGVIIDEKCKDVCRLRIYSYDNGDYFNFDAVPYTKLLSEVQRPIKKKSHREVVNKASFSNNVLYSDNERMELIKQGMNNNGIYFAKGNREGFTFKFASRCKEHGVSFDSVLSECLSWQESDFTASEIRATVRRNYNKAVVKYNDAQLRSFVNYQNR
ncbi:MAG: BT4734/BF3469 family protein [Bacteroidota bacterium]